MSNDTYNGWANWATWNMALWLNNEEYSYRTMRRCYDGDSAKSIALGFYPNGTPDMVKSDLELVDWDEICDDTNTE